MTPAPRVPRATYAYIGIVATAGMTVVAQSYLHLVSSPPELGWLILAALTWVSGMFALKIPSTTATISVSEVFVFTLAILYGGPAATLTVAIDGFLCSVYRGNRAPRRLLFNVFEPSLSVWVACDLYRSIGGIAPLSLIPAALSALVLPVFVLAASYLLMNTWLTAGVMAIESRTSVIAIWRKHVIWLSVNFLAGASIAMLLAVNMRQVSLEGLLLIVPLVFLLYLVFRTWTARVTEADAHISTINRLYLSTVEALAIAIESKDQVTSNHVRRVQNLSLAIARYLGVTDDVELRAIEAGALLHDIGKVAVPDYLLNKPGQLTPDEYELIKLHAPIGAEILRAVDFPYPVVPIVRHHHENWDGTGYPDRISGNAIPIGARIISVVDCFDALTSDRPYRRALSERDAIAIIQARKGTTYSPPVVDALMACYEEARSKTPPLAASDARSMIARLNQRPMIAEPSRTATIDVPDALKRLDEMWTTMLASVTRQLLQSGLGIHELASWLRTATPASTVCVGNIDGPSQSVNIRHVSGHGEQLLRDWRIGIGEGITGWVAANGVAAINSDPALDFPNVVDSLTPRLVAGLVVPIGPQAVLALYTDRPAGFDPGDVAVVERAAQLLDSLLAPPPILERSTAPATEVTSPNRLQNRADMTELVMASLAATRSCGILSIACTNGRDTSPPNLIALAALVLPTVRLIDGVMASVHDEVVAVLPGCEADAEDVMLARLQLALDSSHHALDSLTVGFAVAAHHEGRDFAEGLKHARDRRRLVRRGSVPPRTVGLTAAIGSGS